MTLHIHEPEVVSVTESSVTVAFTVEDDAGPVDARAVVKLNGEPLATSEGASGTRLLRIEGLRPDTRYRVSLKINIFDPFGSKVVMAPARGYRGSTHRIKARKLQSLMRK